MSSQTVAILDRASFSTKKLESLPAEAHRLPILAVLTKAAKPVQFVKLVTDAFIIGCFDHLVLAQLCYPTEHANFISRALEEAQIKTVSFGIVGPIPQPTEISDLQIVLESIAPSVKVLAIKGQSARVIATHADLLNLQSVKSLMPNTRLQVRVPDLTGKWQSLQPQQQSNPPTASSQAATVTVATTASPVPETKKSTSQTLPIKQKPEKPPCPTETINQGLDLPPLPDHFRDVQLTINSVRDRCLKILNPKP
jgi:hypothetical protein